MQPMEWVDRYINEVGRLLPTNERTDVELELRSLIEDELEAALGGVPEAGESPACEATVVSVLQKFGPPEEIADRYLAPRYLIGPVLFPIYRMVLGIVLTIILALSLFGLAFALGSPAGQRTVGEALLDLIASLLQAFGSVTLIFAITEYFMRGEQPAKRQAWDPRTLPAVKDPDRIKRGETVFELVFAIVAIVLLNVYAVRPLTLYNVGGQTMNIPLFSPQFVAFVPWLTAIWVADLVLTLYVLAKGFWQTWSRWLSLAISLAGMIVLGLMLLASPLSATPALEFAVRAGVAVAFIVTGLEAAGQIYRLAKRYLPVGGHTANMPTQTLP